MSDRGVIMITLLLLLDKYCLCVLFRVCHTADNRFDVKRDATTINNSLVERVTRDGGKCIVKRKIYRASEGEVLGPLFFVSFRINSSGKNVATRLCVKFL